MLHHLKVLWHISGNRVVGGAASDHCVLIAFGLNARQAILFDQLLDLRVRLSACSFCRRLSS